MSEPQNKVQHIVFVWLKDAGNTAHRQQIVEVSKSFKEIPSVLDVGVGEVISSERKIVDDSYDVGIIVTCADEKGMQEYLAHPIHQKAKKEVLLPLLKKVLVYDFKE
ncbi:MAG: Dabb family protein [Lentisphaeraceae bacterium]|nr:Dabb family protein [Lentisphaeraceae bacterium]